MNSHSIKSAIKFGGAAALILAATTVTFRAQADERNEETRITINEPIQVTKTVLNPGTYVFKLAVDSQWNRNVVQIYNADQTRIIATIIAMHDTRRVNTGQQFSFYETPAGSVKALHTWFYPGEIDGSEFPYPKQLTMLTARATPAAAPAPAPPEPQAEAPAPPPPPQEQATVETQTQVEIAQNTPPPAPEPPAAVETPAAEQPATLPKTATPFPLFGLGGLLSFAGYGLLRLKRLA